MSLLPRVPAFIPPVVGLPAASAVAPFVPPIAGGAALAAGMLGGAPPLAVIAGGLLAGAALGAALAQLWGWAGGRRGQVSNLPSDVLFEFPDSTESGVFSRGADGLGVSVVFDGYSGNWLTPDFGRGFVWWFQFSVNGLQKLMFLRGIRSDGSLGDVWTLPKTLTGNDQWVSAGTTWQFIKTLPSGDTEEVPKVPPFSPNPYGVPPLPKPAPAEDDEAKPATVPPPLPKPLPTTDPGSVPRPGTPSQPAPPPLVPVTPGPKAPPAVRPATPISPQQPKAPAPIATNNGNLVAPAPLPVPTTPEDAIFPVPGGRPVTGRTMTPTVQAVAQEVGRIEQKIDRMLNPEQGQWGDATDRLQLLWQLLSQLYNALTDGAPAGAYQLSSPCVTDEDGVRVVSEVEWTEQGTNHGAILARVDAIAALLQVHKDLKQPNCHIPPVAVGGEFVTVNFEQID